MALSSRYQSLILSCLIGSSCATISNKDYSTLDQITLATAVTCQVADVATTQRVLDLGGVELNPLFGKHPRLELLIASKLGVLTLIYFWGELVPEARTINYGIASGFGCAAAGWNSYQIISQD